MASLTASELVKYPNRLPTFIKKYVKKEDFELLDGRSIKLKYERRIHGILKTENQSQIAQLRFKQDDCKECLKAVPLGALKMTEEFKPTVGSTTRDEDAAIAKLNKLIQMEGGDVDIRIGSDTFHGIKYAIKVSNTIKSKDKRKGDEVKADIMLVSSKSVPFQTNTIFISHKAPRKGNVNINMRQYGGISKKSGLIDLLDRSDLDEIENFLVDVSFEIEDEKLRRPIKRKVKSKKIIQLCIFGIDFGKKFGLNNVHMIGQGDPVLTKENEVFRLTFANKTVLSGDISKFVGTEYQPVLGAVYSFDTKKMSSGEKKQYIRGFSIGGEYIRGARVMLYPNGANDMKIAKEI